jgi:hypothetical protein
MATLYQIRVEGHLSSRWSDWFAPLVIHNEPDGQAILTGPLRDQAELHGMLIKVRDLNLTLIAVTRMEPTP